MIVLEPPYVPEPPPPAPPVPRRRLAWWDALVVLAVAPACYLLCHICVALARGFMLAFNGSGITYKQILAQLQSLSTALLGSALAQMAIVLFLLTWGYWRLRERTRPELGLVLKTSPAAWIVAPALGLLPVVFAMLLSALSNYLGEPPDAPLMRMIQQSSVLELACFAAFAIAVAPLCEELLFRGFLYPIAARYARRNLAIAGVAAAFVAMHIMQTGGYWIAMVMIGMVAVVLTCERAFFDSIIPCWITHACYNTAMMCLLAVGLAGEAFVKVYYYAHVYRALLPAHWRF